jgi:hypothetical protein
MADRDAVKYAMYALVYRFVERLRLVYDAISELRPDFLWFGNPDTNQWLHLHNQYRHVPDAGHWYKDGAWWQYTTRGYGCQLTHEISGEPLEWDAPNPQVFDSYWFINWLEWLLAQDDDDDDVELVRLAFAEQNTARIFAALCFSTCTR